MIQNYKNQAKVVFLILKIDLSLTKIALKPQ